MQVEYSLQIQSGKKIEPKQYILHRLMRVGGGKKGDDSSVDTERDPPKKHPHAHYLVDTFRQKFQQKDH